MAASALSYPDVGQRMAAPLSLRPKVGCMALITYLVEDNKIVLENLVEALQEIAAVEVTGHGATQAEATHWLKVHNGEWHLAIVDLFLKEGSGLGVLAGCRNRKPDQKVVVLTNYATQEIRRRAADLGADAVFDKSSELDGLFAYCMDQTARHAEPDGPQAQRKGVSRNHEAPSAGTRRRTPGRQG
jgi:two-component system OmpR family response regulator